MAKLTKDELLAKAKIDYPIGTKYIDAAGDIDFILNNDLTASNIIFTQGKEMIYGDSGCGCLYINGKWAEIISKPNLVEFTIGKWYKNSEKTYAKCSEIKDSERFLLNERIDNGIYVKSHSTWSRHSGMKEVDVSEIQQYLPDGHVDKMSYFELMPIGFHPDQLIIENYPLVDKEMIKPKYYKCISNGNADSFNKNKIYKLAEGKTINDEYAFIDNKGRENGWYPNNKVYFIESTKEEYDKQELSNITKSNLLEEEYDSWFSKPKLPPLKYSDLKPGDYFVDQASSDTSPLLINKFISENNYAVLSSTSFNINKYSCYFDDPYLLRPANFPERIWIDKCIEAGKFIPKEEALNASNIIKQSKDLINDIVISAGPSVLTRKNAFLNLESSYTGSVDIEKMWNDAMPKIDPLVSYKCRLIDFVSKGGGLEFQTPVIIKSKSARKNKLIIIN